MDRRQALSASALLGMTAAAGGLGMTATTSARAAETMDDVGVVPVPLPEPAPQTEGLVDVGDGHQIWYFDTGGTGNAVIFLHAAPAAVSSGAISSRSSPRPATA